MLCGHRQTFPLPPSPKNVQMAISSGEEQKAESLGIKLCWLERVTLVFSHLYQLFLPTF